jgi:hypothetical protein
MISLFCWISVGSTPANAADILKMETESTVETMPGSVTARVVFTNRGTAPAYNIQVHLTALGITDASPVIASLNPGQSDEALFERNAQEMAKGRYPMTVRVDFHDANQYPFSALSGMTFHIGEAVNPDLAAMAQDMTLDGSGTLRITLKNMGLTSAKIAATLTLPKEFSTGPSTKTFDIDPRSEKTVEFEIRNFSALPGAAYPVFCYFEYDAKGVHHTALARSLITVAQDETVFRRFRWAWMTLAGILGALLILVLLRGRRQKAVGP